jgi:hypothetical protein
MLKMPKLGGHVARFTELMEQVQIWEFSVIRKTRHVKAEQNERDTFPMPEKGNNDAKLKSICKKSNSKLFLLPLFYLNTNDDRKK